jgi:hypothetical protein
VGVLLLGTAAGDVSEHSHASLNWLPIEHFGPFRTPDPAHNTIFSPVLRKMLSVANAFKISDHQYNPR